LAFETRNAAAPRISERVVKKGNDCSGAQHFLNHGFVKTLGSLFEEGGARQGSRNSSGLTQSAQRPPSRIDDGPADGWSSLDFVTVICPITIIHVEQGLGGIYCPRASHCEYCRKFAA